MMKTRLIRTMRRKGRKIMMKTRMIRRMRERKKKDDEKEG